MKIRDYRYIDEKEIYNIYIKLLSKNTGKKYFGISHPTLKKEVEERMILDIMKYLSVSQVQAQAVLLRKNRNNTSLKNSLLMLDGRIEEITSYRYFDYLYKVTKYRSTTIAIFYFLLIIDFAFFLLILLSKQHNQEIIYTFIGVVSCTLIGIIYNFFYYRFVLKLKSDIINYRSKSIQGVIEKITLKREPEFGHNYLKYTSFIAIMILVNQGGKKKKYFYPVLGNDISLSGRYFKIKKIKQTMIDELSLPFKTSFQCYQHGKLIHSEIPQLERLISQLKAVHSS